MYITFNNGLEAHTSHNIKLHVCYGCLLSSVKTFKKTATVVLVSNQNDCEFWDSLTKAENDFENGGEVTTDLFTDKLGNCQKVDYFEVSGEPTFMVVNIGIM